MSADRGAPVFYVKVYRPGAQVADRVDVSERVTSFEFEDHEAIADKLSIDLDNFDLSVFDDPLWKKGNLIECAWGYAGNLAPAREVVITSIKGGLQIKVEGLAKSILMNQKPRARLFEHMTRSQIVAQIAKENGYSVEEQQIEDTKIVLPHVSQTNLTDAQFLKSLAAREGFQFYVDYEGLHFHRRRMGGTPRRVFTYYLDQVGDVLSFNVENDITAKPGAVAAKGRDPLSKKDIDVTADNASTQRDALAPVIEIVDPVTGEASLQPTGASATILTSADDAASAKREAAGRFIQAQQTTVLMALSCIGDPQIAAKQIVELRGLGKRLSGKYYIRVAKHRIGSEYTMDLSLRSDGTQGTGTVGNTKSDGAQNTKEPGDANALTPREIIDPVTGETTVQFVQGAQKP